MAVDVRAWALLTALVCGCGSGHESPAGESRPCESTQDCADGLFCSSEAYDAPDAICSTCAYAYPYDDPGEADLCPVDSYCQREEESCAPLAQIIPTCDQAPSVVLMQAVSLADEPVDVVAGDFDSDGVKELLVSDVTGKVELLAYPLDGPGAMVDGLEASFLAAGDLTGDQILDLVAAAPSPDSSIRVFEGDGAGGFTQLHHAPDLVAEKIEIASFDDDPAPEILIANGGDGFLIADYDDSTGLTVIFDGAGARPRLSGDFTGGPGADLYFDPPSCPHNHCFDRYSASSWVSGTLENSQIVGAWGELGFGLVDLDGDGRPELLGLHSRRQYGTSRIQRFDRGEGSTVVAGELWGYEVPNAPSIGADVDGNGVTDIVSYGGTSFTVHFREPDGPGCVGSTTADVGLDSFFSDLDGDGRDEFVNVRPTSLGVLAVE